MFLQCPKCGKGGGNRLQRGGVVERLLSCVYIYPYRCMSCWRRFRALRWGTRYVRTQGNRRRHRRFQTHFPVVFSYGQKHGEGVVTNIAMGGCRLQTEVQLTEDTPLELKLQVPGSEGEIRVEMATVSSVGGFFAGLSFSQFAGAEKKRLRRFLIQLMTNQSEGVTCLENPF